MQAPLVPSSRRPTEIPINALWGVGQACWRRLPTKNSNRIGLDSSLPPSTPHHSLRPRVLAFQQRELENEPRHAVLVLFRGLIYSSTRPITPSLIFDNSRPLSCGQPPIPSSQVLRPPNSGAVHSFCSKELTSTQLTTFARPFGVPCLQQWNSPLHRRPAAGD